MLGGGTVSMWETGKTRPRAALLTKLEKLYCCTVDELLAEDTDRDSTHSGA